MANPDFVKFSNTQQRHHMTAQEKLEIENYQKYLSATGSHPCRVAQHHQNAHKSPHYYDRAQYQ